MITCSYAAGPAEDAALDVQLLIVLMRQHEEDAAPFALRAKEASPSQSFKSCSDGPKVEWTQDLTLDVFRQLYLYGSDYPRIAANLGLPGALSVKNRYQRMVGDLKNPKCAYNPLTLAFLDLQLVRDRLVRAEIAQRLVGVVD